MPSPLDIDYTILQIAGYPLSLIELVGTASGLLAVWLAARAHIGTWPVSLLNVAAFFVLFYQVQLYSDMLLQVYFFVTSLYGWWHWSSRPDQAAGDILVLMPGERVAWGLAFLSLGDYMLQRYRVMSQLKMSKQEVRDENKSNEGNPEVKGRVRAIQRDMARRRMLNDVPKATVVITNPTHFAVALEYRRGEMAAPKVLAKGADHIALKIRETARQHGVPIVENKPLAQALFKQAEVGDTIPGPLFAAVAGVLAQLVRLKQLVL